MSKHEAHEPPRWVFPLGLPIMKFRLTFDGDLPSGNSPKPKDVWRIRNALHPQLADLWESHPTLERLRRQARTPKNPFAPTLHADIGAVTLSTRAQMGLSGSEPPHQQLELLADEDTINLCAPIGHAAGNFLPLVRKSLYLACDLDILFLRKGDPGATVSQGGDLDNRIKVLFDALRMPAPGEAGNGGAPDADPLYCLLQSDTLIHDFAVRPDRLLNRPDGSEKEVRLVIGVTVKVLEVRVANIPLIGA